ncbi:MAG: hypothetical protein IJJ26_03315 [Victivallales bacterium]|nr:hypothetical protein [Victivallales bacterium]
MKKALLGLLACVASVLAGAFPAGVTFEENGRFLAGGLRFEIIAWTPDWRSRDNHHWTEARGKTQDGVFRMNTSFQQQGVECEVTEEAVAEEDGFSFRARLRYAQPIRLARLCLLCSLPVDGGCVEVDGAPLPIPEQKNRITLLDKKVSRVVLQGRGPAPVSVIGDGHIVCQDNRCLPNPGDTVSVMFLFRPSGGELRESSIELHFRVPQTSFWKVPLDASANRAYRDDGAQAPGWSLQGEEEDFRAFPGKDMTVEGVPFQVSRKAAVAIGGERRAGLSPSVTLPVSGVSAEVRSLNLLHTSAWTPPGRFGDITVRFADGSRETFPMDGRRDCGNWVGPKSRANAAVAWTGHRPDNVIGCYISTFPLPGGKAPVAVDLQVAHKDVLWFVMGMTFAGNRVVMPPVRELPLTIVEGKEWHTLVYRSRTVPGSPLDFSDVLDAPAGKHGRALPAADGTLRFPNGKRLRLYGTNFCQTANFPSHASAEWIAAQMGRYGFNAVRFHHHDGALVRKIQENSTTLDTEAVDKLDYFFYCLKKKGIYMTTDVYTSRPFVSGDGLGVPPKVAFVIDPKGLENWKTFAKAWLGHRNPYTGMTWGEDPALVFVNLVNEGEILSVWAQTKESRRLFTEAFEQWKTANKHPEAKAEQNDPVFCQWVIERENAMHAEMTRFLREEVGVTALVTSLNDHLNQYMTPMRNRFEVVDNHQYHSHPSFLGKSWNSQRMHTQASPIAGMSWLPRVLMATRVTGKPFFVTEFNYCNPNQFRAEGGPLMGAYAAFQDWDGMFRFCFSHNIKRIEGLQGIQVFESCNEPMMQLSERVIAAMFLQEHVSPARDAFSYPVPTDIVRTAGTADFPIRYQLLGLLARIGSHVEGTPLPEGTVLVNPRLDAANFGALATPWQDACEQRRANSPDGQLRIDADAQTFVVRSPKSEAVCLTKGSLGTGGVLAVAEPSVPCTVVAISRDGLPLATSRSILLLHQTNVSNANTKFGDATGNLVVSEGELEHKLVHRGKAEISLTLSGDAPLKVQALSVDGDPLGAVPCRDGRFTVATDLFPAGVMAYHLTR